MGGGGGVSVLKRVLCVIAPKIIIAYPFPIRVRIRLFSIFTHTRTPAGCPTAWLAAAGGYAARLANAGGQAAWLATAGGKTAATRGQAKWLAGACGRTATRDQTTAAAGG